MDAGRRIAFHFRGRIGQETQSLFPIRGVQSAGRETELHEDPVGIVGVDRSAPSMVHFDHVHPLAQPAFPAGLKVRRITRLESEVIGPRRQPEPRSDGGRPVAGKVVVVQVPERDQNAAACVPERSVFACGLETQGRSVSRTR